MCKMVKNSKVMTKTFKTKSIATTITEEQGVCKRNKNIKSSTATSRVLVDIDAYTKLEKTIATLRSQLALCKCGANKP